MSESSLRKQSSEEKSSRRVTLSTPLEKEELAVSTPSQRNWRGILIALLVIVAVLGLILCAIMMLMPLDDGPRVKGTLFSINGVNSGQFTANIFNGTWVSEMELVYMDQNGGITVLCAENMTTRQLMTNLTFRQINAEDYKVSSDLNFVLLMTDIIPLWEHSYKAKHHIYDVTTQVTSPLRLAELDEFEIPYLESVTFTPTGSGVAFIYNNDIYYKPNVKKSHEFRLTSDGLHGLVFNGRPDYLYETRILQSGTAMWFSPDSVMLLYASFNCSLVGEQSYAYYGNSIYEEIRKFRYPKPGTKNPEVRLTVVDLRAPKYLKVKNFQPPSFYTKEKDYYMTGAKWIGTREVAATWMNRRQNVSSVSTCVFPEWSCINNFTMNKSPTHHWVNQIPQPIFDANLTSFLTILPMPEGDKNSLGGFLQVFQVNSTSTRYVPLTGGTLTVFEVLAWDLNNHFVYFIASVEPARKQLFRAGDLDMQRTTIECLICWEDNTTSYTEQPTTTAGVGKLSNRTDTTNITHDPSSLRCSSAKAYFNAVYNPKFYVLECLGPDVPRTVLVDLSTNTIIYALDTNSELRALYSSMAKPQIKTLQVEIENGYNAQVRLFLPPGLREYEDMTFPLILHVDSRPGTQLVKEEYHVDWFSYLAGKRNFIIAQIDARGTGAQGEKIIQEIFYRLGTVEVEDQIAVISYLRSVYRYIDPQRIAVFGEGHGGYLAAMILSKDDNKLFKCGVAVNPISSFRHTDSFFTERYMGIPNSSDNYSGYTDAELSKRAGNLKEKDFLLITSTANQAVPFVHSAKLVQALVKEGVQYKHQVYPDVGEDLTPVSDHYHNLVDSFWDECFKPLDFYDWETMGSFIPFSKE